MKELTEQEDDDSRDKTAHWANRIEAESPDRPERIAEIRGACKANIGVLRYAPIQPETALWMLNEIERLTKETQEYAKRTMACHPHAGPCGWGQEDE